MLIRILQYNVSLQHSVRLRKEAVQTFSPQIMLPGLPL
jgi:hypothetical protein